MRWPRSPGRMVFRSFAVPMTVTAFDKGYRILYRIDDANRAIYIYGVAHSKDAYR
jgi:hypothetical protein